MGFINIFEIDFLDDPPREAIQEAINELRVFDAIDAKGEITEIGHKVSFIDIVISFLHDVIVSLSMSI